ncbi:MAG: putative DNA binding domain-containing protein [Erysipelotrichales bacterium]|nr:putative DNA binding domain-containing protein [Erysipelotrichales bacterium]
MIHESTTLELKENLNDKFEKTIIAFLNTNGGNLYIGFKDDGSLVGVAEIDSIQLQIKNRLRDNIMPSTLGLFEVSVEKKGNKQYINVIVARGNERPYYLKAKGMSPEGCFMRVANSTEKMPLDMITTLFSKRARNSLKNILSPNQDLTFSELKILYNELGYEFGENLLKQLDLINDDNQYNYLAYLMADNNNLSFKIAKYLGKDAFNIIENEELGNTCLIKVTKRILEKLNIENTTFAKITDSNREEIKKIESIALKEAVINAIVHNDYTNEYPPKFELFDDRLEITSTGGLPDNFTKEDFLGGFSAPRNKELMGIFKDLRLVEHLGTGIRRILRSYEEEIFDFYPNFLKVTFIFNEFDKIKFSKKSIESLGIDGAILNLIEKNASITVKELAESIKVAERTILRYINVLIEKKQLVRIGSKKSGFWKIL